MEFQLQHLSHIFSSVWRQLSCEKSLLVIYKILSLLVNKFLAEGKYSLLDRDNSMQPFQMQFSQKQKYFSQLFSKFLKSIWGFEHYQKRRPSQLMYFQNYRLRKMWLHHCLKSPVSESPSKSNMVNCSKHCWNLNGSIFTIFIDHCEGNWAAKIICEWYANSYNFFLTKWLPMTSILFLI